MDGTDDMGVGRGGAAIPRDENGRFLPGGPGRPLGALNKASTRVSSAILADFEDNKAEMLPRLRRWFVPQYVALVGRLLPRPLADGGADAAAGGAGPGGEGADSEAPALTIAAIRAALARIDAEAEAAAAVVGDAKIG